MFTSKSLAFSVGCFVSWAVYSGFIYDFFSKKLPAVAGNEVDESSVSDLFLCYTYDPLVIHKH